MIETSNDAESFETKNLNFETSAFPEKMKNLPEIEVEKENKINTEDKCLMIKSMLYKIDINEFKSKNSNQLLDKLIKNLKIRKNSTANKNTIHNKIIRKQPELKNYNKIETLCYKQ